MIIVHPTCVVEAPPIAQHDYIERRGILVPTHQPAGVIVPLDYDPTPRPTYLVEFFAYETVGYFDPYREPVQEPDDVARPR